MMAQGRNLLDVFDALWGNADGRGGDPATASLATSMPGNRTHRRLCTASQPAASHTRLTPRPRRSSISALLAALAVAPGPRAPYRCCVRPAFCLTCETLMRATNSVLAGLTDDTSWFLRTTGRFTSLRYLTGPYLLLSRWSPDWDTHTFGLRG